MSSWGYGSAWREVIAADIRDRIQGRTAQANARLGLVRAPAGRGKVVWVRAGASYESVLLASEITGALRQKRRDVRLVLTVEYDYPDVIMSRLGNMERVGFGYGCCDLPSVVQRVLHRFQPLGVVCVQDLPGSNLRAALHASGVRTIACQTPQATEFETSYPSLWDEATGADLSTLLVNPQLEPSFRAALGLSETQNLFWAHGLSESAVQTLLFLWQDDRVNRNGILCLTRSESPGQGSAAPLFGYRALNASTVRLSVWDRVIVRTPAVIEADDPKWWPAVAASANRVLFGMLDTLAFWQAMAAGVEISLDASRSDFPICTDTDRLVRSTPQEWLMRAPVDSISSRQVRDSQRQLFWRRRREAQAVLDTLTQQVYDW